MPEQTPQSRPQLFSEEFIARIGEDLANQIIDQICQGLTTLTPAQRPTTLCIELIVFEIDEHILRNLVKCTFAQLNPVLITQEIMKAFRHVNHYLKNHKANLSGDSSPYPASSTPSTFSPSSTSSAPSAPATAPTPLAPSEPSTAPTPFAPSEPSTAPTPLAPSELSTAPTPPAPPTPTVIPGSPTPSTASAPLTQPAQHTLPPPIETYDLNLCKFELLSAVVKKLRDLSSTLLDACDLRERLFEEILLHPTLLPASELKNLYTVINHVIIQQFREMLITQYDNFALKLCNKTSCINSDLEFLTDQIKLLTINFPAAEKGIIEIADAAGSVAESFFSEKDDFDEIFDAVDAVAEVIEDLAEFYQVKLDQLAKLLSLSTAGCPVPIQARVTLPSIPETPPPPPIFPVITVPGSISLPTTPSLIP